MQRRGTYLKQRSERELKTGLTLPECLENYGANQL